MDAVLTTLIGAAPQLGVGGILLTLLTLLMRRESQDRADHRVEVAELATRHADELKRIHESHAEELAELRADIKALREKRDLLNQRLDDERTRRRTAEDSMQPRHRRDPGGAP